MLMVHLRCLPLLGRRIEVQGGWFWGGGRGGSLKNWTEVQFASWPLWCGGIYAPAFKLSGEMCQKLVSAGARGIKIYPSYMFFQQNKFDDYLNDFEMRAWQVPGNGNGAFVTIQSRENTHFEVTLPHSFFSLSVRLVLTSFWQPLKPRTHLGSTFKRDKINGFSVARWLENWVPSSYTASQKWSQILDHLFAWHSDILLSRCPPTRIHLMW